MIQQTKDSEAGMGETTRKLVVNDRRHVPADAVPSSGDVMQTLAAAVQRGLPVETLNALMDFQERYQKNEARRAFDEAMAAARAELPIIIKNREVDFTSAKGRTNYVYEDLASIAKAVDPILAKHGLAYRFRTAQDGSNVTVTCIISHKAGYSEENSLNAARDESGNKNSIQAVGSAVTYLQRYTLKAALGLSATKDDDAAATKEEDYDTSQWTEKLLIAGADRDAIIKVGEEIKADKTIPPNSLKILRAAWAGAMKQANEATEEKAATHA